MPSKKVKTYVVVEAIDSISLNRIVYPGETVEMSPDDAKVLLELDVIKEVANDSNSKLDELGELQDRAQ